MGDTIDVWRARIGRFTSAAGPRKRHKSHRCLQMKLLTFIGVAAILTFFLLVENPRISSLMRTAPLPLKSGFLIHEIEVFVVQNILMTATYVAIAASLLRSPYASSPATRQLSHSSFYEFFRDHCYFMAVVAFATISILLIRGGIEPNPGPFPCRLCSVVPETIASSIRHQHYHAKNRSYLYYCPADDCQFRSSSFGSLNFHVSQVHRDTRHVDPAATVQISCSYIVNETNCDFTSTSLWNFVQHLCKKHLEEDGLEIQCPIRGCTFSKNFSKASNFRTHLSQCHKNWKAEGCPAVKECFESVAPPLCVPLEFPGSAAETIFNLNANDVSIDADSDINCDLLNDQFILDSIAKFYLHLYAQNLLPQETIQEICDSLIFLSEIGYSRTKLLLSKELKSLNIPQDKINFICMKVLNADLLYSSHHKSSPGPTLTSDYFRKQYFTNHFDFVEPKEINLEPSDPASKKTLQYVSIPQSLSKLLEDSSVQKEVDESFEEQQGADPDIVSNYTDGDLFKSENHPLKEIHLTLYQDSFNPVMNALGSAKNKYKDLVVYFTIANIRSHLRSMIDTKQLVLICRESVFKLVGAKKCLEEMMSELKDLESKGIFYKGEWIKVVVQFMLGDNLGQHVIGGFIESFSGTYFCRFCEVKRKEFKENPTLTKPPRLIEDFHRCVFRAKLLDKPVKGIKKDCELNCLKYFSVVSHLPVCCAHDLMEGVVSWDLSGIIARFISKKWITYKLLNRRIQHFKCVGIDSRNKPALVSEKGKKLGGHAVQNWMMLRLFYFLIGDKIQDLTDPGWILYLQLKELCEFFCAPSFKKSDVPYAKDVLIPAYFENRRSVLSAADYPLKPKHHFMAHYPELMLKYGPIIHVWTMPYEQKHKFFKELMRKTKNFINPEKSCAVRQQMRFCHVTSNTLFEHGFFESKSKRLTSNSFSGELACFILNLNWQNYLDSESVFSDGILYKKSDTIILSASGNSINVGIIKVLASKEDIFRIIIEKRSARYQPSKGIYEIDLHGIVPFDVLSPSDLKHPVPQPVYTYGGRSCFSLKHYIIRSD